jgi:type I restriction-modification system DNA methylase subunit
MDTSEYKHVCLGLIFLKYISDAFEEKRERRLFSFSDAIFVQSEKFVEEHGGRVGDIAVYGQKSNYTARKLARMNLAIRVSVRWKAFQHERH